MKRGGLGSRKTIEGVALYLLKSDGGKERLTNPRSFTSSDNQATLVLSPRLNIKDGETVTIQVVGEIGCAELSTTLGCTATDLVNNQEFWVAINSSNGVMTNTDDVAGNFPVQGSTFSVA